MNIADMKTGFYWFRERSSQYKTILYFHAETKTAAGIASEVPIELDDSIVIISPVIESVTVEQTEAEFEWVEAFHNKPPVVRQRAEFPAHEVTIEHNGHKTVFVGIVKQDGDRRTDFTTIHHLDGSVTFNRGSSVTRIRER